MIKCVVFDFDGTLVDSNEIKTHSFYEIVRAYDPDGTVVAAVLGRRPAGDRFHITREIAHDLMARGALPPGPGIEDWAQAWAEAYTDQCEQAIATCPEMPGATHALDALSKQGLALFLNSATPLQALTPIVRRRSLARYFQRLYGSSQSKVENLQHIQKIAATSKAEMIFVGDGEDDRWAASAFQCRFVGVVLRGQSRFDQAPEIQIDTLGQLEGILGELNAELSLVSGLEMP